MRSPMLGLRIICPTKPPPNTPQNRKGIPMDNRTDDQQTAGWTADRRPAALGTAATQAAETPRRGGSFGR